MNVVDVHHEGLLTKPARVQSKNMLDSESTGTARLPHCILNIRFLALLKINCVYSLQHPRLQRFLLEVKAVGAFAIMFCGGW